ncbi:phosphodiester glycosidase family protein [Synechocystis sp. PCC 7509]|uniref:phosphodiester glycosidase family protein n=1 Tax=Synechocystis sp. PCC 7509 TaxID=927677 RepID=UPI0002ABC857|nr:phosphodiester glycosidase family protein [Synechocystis sp. PCC 7509]
MIRRRKNKLGRVLLIVGISFLALLILIYGGLCLSRPPRTNLEQQLFPGVTYQRQARSTPRRVMLHIVTVDLTTPNLKFLVTPGTPRADGREINARTTTSFVHEFGVNLAVNGSFFLPFYDRTPWNYYPHTGDRVDVLGQAISNGNIYSPSDPIWSVLCIASDNSIHIQSQKCNEDTIQAVSGNGRLVKDGIPVPPDPNVPHPKFMPCTVVGINQAGDKLMIIVVDGRQPFYSEGLNLAQLTDICIELGIYTGINLDGGGSSTLVMAKNGQPVVLNAPIHTRVPMRQRPVANHLGIYFE